MIPWRVKSSGVIYRLGKSAGYEESKGGEEFRKHYEGCFFRAGMIDCCVEMKREKIRI